MNLIRLLDQKLSIASEPNKKSATPETVITNLYASPPTLAAWTG